MMVRVGFREVTRGIEILCASAGVKLVRVFPVVGWGSNHSAAEGGGRQSINGVRGPVGNTRGVRDIQVEYANVRKPETLTG